MGMNFRKCVAVILFGLGSALAAHAQVGVYGEYSADKLSGVTCFDPQGECSSKNGVVNPSGLMGGAYYDFKTFGPVRFGIDARGGVARSNKSAVTAAGGKDTTTENYFLAGVRGTFHTKYSFLKPYLQASAGFARSNATEPTITTYDSFVKYEGFGGVDIKILPMLDLRAVELGIGNMDRVGSGTGGSSLLVRSIGVGIVLHLPQD
jgi:hypothetical protein